MIATILARHCLQPAFHARALWQHTRLSYKFAAAAAVTLVIALAGLASLVADQLAEAVVDKFAAGAALYSDSVVAPLIQETARRSSLSDAKRRELDSIFAPTVIKRPIVSFRIWVGNHIIYSNSPEVIGKEFAPSLSRDQAWNGAVAAEINQLDSDDDAPTKELNLPILEVYAPLREAVTGRIFALAETHEIATDLLLEIRKVKEIVWSIFSAMAIGMTLVLFLALKRGKRENDESRTRLIGANRRVCQINERHMQRVASELHNGPVQLVGLALLKLDPVREMIAKLGAPAEAKDVEAIRSALDCALEEIISLTETLVPSRINTLSLAETIDIAARRHELRAGVRIDRDIAQLPLRVLFPVKACVYKFVLETLVAVCDKTNSQFLRAWEHNNFIAVEICVNQLQGRADLVRGGKWLEALRDEVESIGGSLFIKSSFETVTYTAKIELQDPEQLND
jgi:signal transduction histidine kinase